MDLAKAQEAARLIQQLLGEQAQYLILITTPNDKVLAMSNLSMSDAMGLAAGIVRQWRSGAAPMDEVDEIEASAAVAFQRGEENQSAAMARAQAILSQPVLTPPAVAGVVANGQTLYTYNPALAPGAVILADDLETPQTMTAQQYAMAQAIAEQARQNMTSLMQQAPVFTPPRRDTQSMLDYVASQLGWKPKS